MWTLAARPLPEHTRPMTTPARPDYQIHLDDKFGSLKLIDIPAEVARTGPGILGELRSDDDLVAAVIEKAHWQRRYLDELQRVSAALHSMMDTLAGSALRG